jgi:hypothetical protein
MRNVIAEERPEGVYEKTPETRMLATLGYYTRESQMPRVKHLATER